MSYEKSIVCLANSRKPPLGRCVAGLEVGPRGLGAWVRPVSARPTRELTNEERHYRDGHDPALLDIITICFTEPAPEHHQTENHIIDPRRRWVRRGRFAWVDLLNAVESPGGPLWLNGQSSGHGENDRIDDAEAAGLRRSLYLVRPERLRLRVRREAALGGPARRRVRALFELCGERYCLVVTDPHIEFRCLARDDGEYPVQDALLCVSLSEPFQGCAYKLAAAVITRERAETRL